MKKQLLALVTIISPICANPLVYTASPIVQAGSIPRVQQTSLTVEVSVGELFDKLTILQIKAEHITSPDKLANIHNERILIEKTIETHIPTSPALDRLVARLKQINEQLWEIEDAIRAKEAAQEFDQEFIDLARSVYFTNDKRGVIKGEINKLLGSRLIEEKQYTHYEKK